jgi:hypothetical protein
MMRGRMNRKRINGGEMTAGVAAVLLFAFMFLDWFGIESSDDSLRLFSVGHSAWDALDYPSIIILMVAIIAPLVVAVLRLANLIDKPAFPVNVVVAIFGLIAVLLIFLQILDPPSFGSFGTSFGLVTAEGTVQFGIFLSLLAAAGIAFGGWRAAQREGASLTDRRLRRR